VVELSEGSTTKMERAGKKSEKKDLLGKKQLKLNERKEIENDEERVKGG
jgi:hypothetical protein